MFKEVNRERPFEEILDQIIDNIQKGILKPGDALPAERLMAEMMGVSRPVVREVLRALELLGIITTVRGGANYISEDIEHGLIGPLSILFRLNNSSVRETQQLRAALEEAAAGLAAERCTAVDAAELQLILARLEAEEDERVRANLDRDLHIKIGKIAGNPMIFNVMCASTQLTENVISGIRAYIMQKNHSEQEVDDQHKRLVEAIVNHRVSEAEICMQEHMRTVENYIVEMMRQS
ncbi:MAG: FadR family transcriptional regulator [Lachnospiraceae bacterium]|nr:FadR family transcriptional regulator [Lachnospiraceae bacterium]